MTLRITWQVATGQFEARIKALQRPIARAATAAMADVRDILKSQGRAEIARAGFSRRWQNAFRVDRYPRSGMSINAAAFAFHRIPYAGVFETGATIAGQPRLWLPLPNVPKRIARRRMTPERFRNSVGDLVSIRSRKGRPLLAATVRLSKRQAEADRPKVSLAALRRGASGRGILRTVPIFHGVSMVRIGKRFDIAGIARRARARIPALYVMHFRDDK